MSKKGSGLVFCSSLILSALLAGCATHSQQVSNSPLVSETICANDVAEYRVLDPFSDFIPKKYQEAAELSRADALARFSGAVLKQLEGNQEGTLDDFVDILQLDPANEEMLVDISRTLIDNGNPEKALELLDLSLKRKDASGEIYSWKAVALLAMGTDYPEALKFARQGVKKSPDHFDTYQVLAGIYLQNGEPDLARELLLQGEKRNSEDLVFLAKLCAYYSDSAKDGTNFTAETAADDMKRIGEKVEVLSSSLELKNLSNEQLVMLGAVASVNKDLDKALKYYTTLYERDKDNVLSQIRVATVSIEMENFDFAEKILRKVLMSGQSPECYAVLGDLYLKKGELRQAADFYYYAGTVNQNPSFYVRAAAIRINLKEYQKALDLTELAMSKGVDSIQIEVIRGEAFSKIEKYDKALKCYELAELHADSSQGLDADSLEELLTPIYVVHGEVFSKINAYDEEIAFAEKVLKRYPNSLTLLNSFAYLFAEQSVNLDEAKIMIKKALSMQSDADAGQLSAYLDTLAWVLYKLGNYTEALDYQLQSLEKRQEELAEMEKKEDLADFHGNSIYRGSIELYNHLAAIYEAMGDKKKALECRKKAEEIDKQYPEE